MPLAIAFRLARHPLPLAPLPPLLFDHHLLHAPQSISSLQLFARSFSSFRYRCFRVSNHNPLNVVATPGPEHISARLSIVADSVAAPRAFAFHPSASSSPALLPTTASILLGMDLVRSPKSTLLASIVVSRRFRLTASMHLEHPGQHYSSTMLLLGRPSLRNLNNSVSQIRLQRRFVGHAQRVSITVAYFTISLSNVSECTELLFLNANAPVEDADLLRKPLCSPAAWRPNTAVANTPSWCLFNCSCTSPSPSAVIVAPVHR